MNNKSSLIGKRLHGKTVKSAFVSMEGKFVYVYLEFDDGSTARYDLKLVGMVSKVLGLE